MAIYLVTGGAGFIGSNLAEFLVRQGEKVRVLDNLVNGRYENLSFLETLPGAKKHLEFIEGDICDPETAYQACKGVDYILHQAALGSVPASVEDPEEYHRVNATGTLTLLRAAAKAGVKRFIYAGSSSAYGDTGEEKPTPKKETNRPQPLSPYAVAKLTGEYYCQIFPSLYGLETVVLRYFNVYGPRQDPKSQYAAVIPKFITALLKGEPVTIFGDGEQTRDFIYVEDVVRANLLACQADRRAVGQVINVASGQAVSINELYQEIARLIGVKTTPHYTSPRAGDVRHSLADVTKAKELLGLKELISLKEGLKRTISWYRDSLS